MPDETKTITENLAALADTLGTWAAFASRCAAAVHKDIPGGRTLHMSLGVLAGSLNYARNEARRASDWKPDER
jgi:hypothetical protein